MAPGCTCATPTVATVSGRVGADALDDADHFGDGGERIAAHGHRHGAGMARLADDVSPGAGDPVDGGDDADRKVAGFQERALLDMDFEIAAIGLRVARQGRNDPSGSPPKRISASRSVTPSESLPSSQAGS